MSGQSFIQNIGWGNGMGIRKMSGHGDHGRALGIWSKTWSEEEVEQIAERVVASYGPKSLQYLVDEMQAAIRADDDDRAKLLDRVRRLVEQRLADS